MEMEKEKEISIFFGFGHAHELFDQLSTDLFLSILVLGRKN
jgi:hypothetical protein